MPDNSAENGRSPRLLQAEDASSPIFLAFALDGTTVELVRFRCPLADGDPGVSIWKRSYDAEIDVERLVAFVSPRSDRWLGWSRLAETLGRGALTNLLDDEILLEEDRLAIEAERTRLEEEALERAAAEAQRLALLIESRSVDAKNGWYNVTLQRGDGSGPFFTMRFMEKWERERFRDWFWNQTDRYREFAERLEQIGDKALERELLREMVLTERTVKEAGLAMTGRRPLRFWRGDLK